MEKVTISPKFQVVIPYSVRERLNLRPGQQVQVIPYENRIELIPQEKDALVTELNAVVA